MSDHNVSNQPREYVLGTNRDELVRLGLQHRLWADRAHAIWRRAGLGPGQACLDVGCGPGYASFDIAQMVGSQGRVLGVDESDPFVEHVNDQARARGLDNVEAFVGDVQKLGDLAAVRPGSFDAAYTRWVLCFVADPSAVVAGVADALKPGGRFAIQDYFNYRALTLAPKREVFTTVIEAVARAWNEAGGDIDVMGSMPRLLDEHGLDVVDLRVDQRLARPGESMWNWPSTFWPNFLPVLEERGLISGDTRRDFEQQWASAARDPHTFIVLPPVFEIVAVKR